MADKPEAQALSVSVSNGVLTISIGVGLLAFAVQATSVSGWPQDWYITDPVAFAEELARTLESEEEDGTTPVHRMLDAAATETLEQGAESVNEGDPETGLRIAQELMGHPS